MRVLPGLPLVPQKAVAAVPRRLTNREKGKLPAGFGLGVQTTLALNFSLTKKPHQTVDKGKGVVLLQPLCLCKSFSLKGKIHLLGDLGKGRGEVG
jgi:hypothetical protein